MNGKVYVVFNHICFQTRSSAIAEGPCDASCQLKSCQLPCKESTCMTNPEQIEVMKLEVYSGAMCNKHVRSTMTRSSRFHCPIGVINKPTTDDLWISPVYRRLVVSPQYRNCSRDSDYAHLENTHSSQDYDFTWPNHVQNLKSLALAVAKIFHGIKFKNGHLTLTSPLSGNIFH